MTQKRKATDSKTIRDAALFIEKEAEVLFDCHKVRAWGDPMFGKINEINVKNEYDAMLALAKRLRAMLRSKK